MLKHISWALKYIVLPLTPFLAGLLVRVLHEGRLEFSSMNPSELSFSMAMLALVVSVNASRIEDSELRDALTQVFHVGVFLSLVLFSWSVFVQAQMDLALSEWWEQTADRTARSLPLEERSSEVERSQAILGRLRLFATVLAGGVTAAAITCQIKYNLEEL